MNNSIKALWLPAYFPTHEDFYSGDFIERYAQSISQYAEVAILYVCKKEMPQLYTFETVKKNNFSIHYGFYANKFSNRILCKIYGSISYLTLLMRSYKRMRKRYGEFDIIHLHVVHKQAILALWLHFFSGKQIIISEHSSWFTPIGATNFPRQPLVPTIMKLAYKHANNIHSVSAYLKELLQQQYPFIHDIEVIPNVVNTEWFHYNESERNAATAFLHVTGNRRFKNSDAVLRAFARYIHSGHSGQLHIAGITDEALKAMAIKLEIEPHIIWHGLLTNESLANIMIHSDATIMFSRSETFGCVMSESLCCGKPVIASKIPALEEQLTPHENAVYVTPDDENDLVRALIWFDHNRQLFSNKEIARAAMENFNYQSIGLRFLSLYTSALHQM